MSFAINPFNVELDNIGNGLTVSAANALYIRKDGTSTTTASIPFAQGLSTPLQFTSTLATGTAPFIIASTTQVSNLNVSQLQGFVTGTSGGTIPLLNGTNSASGVWSFTNTTPSGSPLTGAVKLLGGLGVKLQIYTPSLFLVSQPVTTGDAISFSPTVQTFTDSGGNAATLSFTGGTDLTLAVTGTGVGFKAPSIKNSSLTSTRLVYSTTNGQQTDSANLTYSGTRLSPKYLTLDAGAAGAGNAPLVLTSGTNLTTPVAGSMEYDGTQLYFSPSTTRNALLQDNGTRLTATRVPFATTNGYLKDDSRLTFDTASGNLTTNVLSVNSYLQILGAQPNVVWYGDYSGNLIISDTTFTYDGFTLLTQGLALSDKVSLFNNVATEGLGVPAIYKVGRATAQTAANTSVATYTTPASDGSYEVSANVLVTTSTVHNFTVTVDYTDEGNTARTATLPFSVLAGTFITAITNASGAVPYTGIPIHIRCKASTAITIKTAGTFTTVTYNAEGIIRQLA